MNTDTQNKMILKALQSGQTLTALDALRLFGCFRLASRIYDLRKQGNPIMVTTIHTLEGKRVAGYYMGIHERAK